MVARNQLLLAPPYPVEQALTRLGKDLRLGRLRRNLTIAEVAEKIGTGPRAVTDAEKGKPSTGIGVYVALLWVYGLLSPLDDIANPLHDKEGLAIESARSRSRARKDKGLDNDF